MEERGGAVIFGRRGRRLQAQALAFQQAAAASARDVERAALVDAIDAAHRIEPVSASTTLMLQAGEGIFLEVEGAVLVEDRRGPGQWSGGMAGLSIPIGGGDAPIRLNTGGARGTYTPGATQATVADIGTFWITNRRVVFHGAHQVRECPFTSLIAVECDEALLLMRYAVRNRKAPTSVSASFDPREGPGLLRVMRDRTELALAHFRNDVPQLITRLQGALDALGSAEPR